jgi:hypothetical protein
LALLSGGLLGGSAAFFYGDDEMATVEKKRGSLWKQKAAAIRSLERDGLVDPAELIEAARDPMHPCHGDFTWDIEKAAEKCWWEEARALIRQCKFEVRVEDVGYPVVEYVSNDEYESPVFHSVPKLRGKAAIRSMMFTEIAMLHGVVSRVYGLALSKQGTLGVGLVRQLDGIKSELRGMKEDLTD